MKGKVGLDCVGCGFMMWRTSSLPTPIIFQKLQRNLHRICLYFLRILAHKASFLDLELMQYQMVTSLIDHQDWRIVEALTQIRTQTTQKNEQRGKQKKAVRLTIDSSSVRASAFSRATNAASLVNLCVCVC